MLTDFKKCFEKKLLIFLPIGFFAGLPLLLTSATLGTWLADVGITMTTVGLFALVSVPYSLKFLWAPLLDTPIFGIFSKKLGLRRSWIIVMEIFICITSFYISCFRSFSRCCDRCMENRASQKKPVRLRGCNVCYRL